MVPATGRYAVQGAQVRAGLELWARRTGARLVVEDDGSGPERAARLHAELLGRGCRFVLGPYGSDSVRAVATASPGTVVWNHGGAADDVQRLPGVVSLPSPASRYLVALGRAVAALRPGAAIAVVAAGGPFARFARQALEREAPSLGLRLAAFSLGDPPAAIAAARPDAVLACGPHGREVALFRALPGLLPGGLLGGSPRICLAAMVESSSRHSEAQDPGPQAWCVCGEKVTIADAREVTLPNGRPGWQGHCPECGAPLFAIRRKPAGG